jgi:hypothetical protein
MVGKTILSVQKYMGYEFSQKSKLNNFDEIYRRGYQQLKYRTKYTMK